MLKSRFFILSGIIVLAIASRLLPHPPNFTPVAAIAIFGGACFADKRVAFAVPFGIMFISDLIIGLHDTLLFVYLGFAVAAGIGYLLKNRISVLNVTAGAIAAAIVFYLITNFGVWLTGTLYPHTYQGLVACFAAGVPFFRYTVLGNLVYCGALFGAFGIAKRYVPALQKV